MRLVVFGATGKTGQPLVRQALEAGHDVTAFARTPGKLEVSHTRLRVVQGAVGEKAAVEAALTDQDAVLSTLGSGNETLTTFAQHAIPAMKEHGVDRIVSLVGAGVAMPGDPSSPGRTLMRGLMKVVARGILQDAQRHSELLQESGLAWTLVRPPRLADGPHTGEYEHAPTMKLGPGDSISRPDVADFMLYLATTESYIRQAPMVAS